MLSLLSQFGLNVIIVCVVLLVHGTAAWMAIGRVGERRRIDKWKARLWAAAVIAILDLPLAYLQLVYKSWHPPAADRIIAVIWIPWSLLQLNLLFLGSVAIAYGMYGAVARFMRRMKGARRLTPAATSITVNHDDMSKADSNVRHDSPDNAGSPLFHRRKFLQTSALAMGGFLLNGSVLAAANGREESRLERIAVRIPNLPEGLKGTTIAMISDIHSSLFMNRRNMEHYAGILKGLKADLIVLPGDFVNSKTREVYPFAEAFSGLEAPLGVYGVTGNHDYYTREIETVAAEVGQAGIRMLRNENIRIEKNGVAFRLLGIDDDAIYDVREYLRDGKTEKGKIENLVRGIGESEPTIFLCHKPYPFEEYARLGIDLTLSGHTHGGQIVLGRIDRLNVSVASLASTYIAGLYKARSNPESQMYVSRGIGTVGLPVRINCPPEVTHITLV